jgi:hypothetical protein
MYPDLLEHPPASGLAPAVRWDLEHGVILSQGATPVPSHLVDRLQVAVGEVCGNLAVLGLASVQLPWGSGHERWWRAAFPTPPFRPACGPRPAVGRRAAPLAPVCHLWEEGVLCSAVQCRAVQCSAVQCSAVQCSAVQCSAVQCSAVQCSAQCAVQCLDVARSTEHKYKYKYK